MNCFRASDIRSSRENTYCFEYIFFTYVIPLFEISENFPGKQMEDECVCAEREEMLHIYNCEILSEGRKPTLKYENIFGDNLYKQIEVFKHCEQNLENRERNGITPM